MKNLMFIMFALFAFCFVSCEGDKNESPAEPKCEPACLENTECKCVENDCHCEAVVDPKPENVCDPACKDTEECKCENDKCECKEKVVVPEPCKCEDGTDCPEGDAAKCEKSVVEDPCKDKAAGDECGENKICTAAEDGKLACMDKVEEKPAPKCEPVCKDTEECVCEADKCECKEKVVTEECFCDEEKKVACPEGGKDACEKAEPEQPKCEPACEGESECVCEADKCECKVPDKVDPEPQPENPGK